MKQEGEIIDQVQSPKYCLDNINRLVNQNPDVFSYPLFATFSTNKSSEKLEQSSSGSTPVQKDNPLYSPSYYLPKSLLKKQTSDAFAQENPTMVSTGVQQNPTMVSTGVQQKPTMVSTGAQQKPTMVSTGAQTKVASLGLGSRMNTLGLGLKQKLETSNLTKLAFPNGKYVDRIVISGIPTGTHLNIGVSYKLEGSVQITYEFI